MNFKIEFIIKDKNYYSIHRSPIKPKNSLIN